MIECLLLQLTLQSVISVFCVVESDFELYVFQHPRLLASLVCATFLSPLQPAPQVFDQFLELDDLEPHLVVVGADELSVDLKLIRFSLRFTHLAFFNLTFFHEFLQESFQL